MRYLWFLTGCLAGGMALNTPTAVGFLDDILFVPMLTTLAGDVLKVLALASLVLFAGAVHETSRWRTTRTLVVATMVTLALEVTLFLIAGPHLLGDSLVAQSGRTPVFLAYKVGFLAYGLASLLIFTTAIGGSARRATGILRYGLALITGGGIAGLCWTAWTGDDIADLLVTGRIAIADDSLSAVLGATTIALGATGATLGLWHSQLAALVRARRAWRDHARLEPLWTFVCATAPDIVLRPVHRIRYRNAEFALYRRVIEIRDGLLALRAHFPPDASRADATTAAEEATMIAAADEARRAGRRYATADLRLLPRIEPTIAGEVAWLGEVADVLVNSSR
jgi:hypothetical protein